ncbi:hypothetical protein HNY73_011600, partial [Argiope bruennichi]
KFYESSSRTWIGRRRARSEQTRQKNSQTGTPKKTRIQNPEGTPHPPEKTPDQNSSPGSRPGQNRPESEPRRQTGTEHTDLTSGTEFALFLIRQESRTERLNKNHERHQDQSAKSQNQKNIQQTRTRQKDDPAQETRTEIEIVFQNQTESEQAQHRPDRQTPPRTDTRIPQTPEQTGKQPENKRFPARTAADPLPQDQLEEFRPDSRIRIQTRPEQTDRRQEFPDQNRELTYQGGQTSDRRTDRYTAESEDPGINEKPNKNYPKPTFQKSSKRTKPRTKPEGSNHLPPGIQEPESEPQNPCRIPDNLQLWTYTPPPQTESRQRIPEVPEDRQTNRKTDPEKSRLTERTRISPDRIRTQDAPDAGTRQEPKNQTARTEQEHSAPARTESQTRTEEPAEQDRIRTDARQQKRHRTEARNSRQKPESENRENRTEQTSPAVRTSRQLVHRQNSKEIEPRPADQTARTQQFRTEQTPRTNRSPRKQP